MQDSKMAYELPIKEGEVRIVIKIEDINVEEENSAKDGILLSFRPKN
jgi:hypothetical protein